MVHNSSCGILSLLSMQFSRIPFLISRTPLFSQTPRRFFFAINSLESKVIPYVHLHHSVAYFIRSKMHLVQSQSFPQIYPLLTLIVALKMKIELSRFKLVDLQHTHQAITNYRKHFQTEFSLGNTELTLG